LGRGYKKEKENTIIFFSVVSAMVYDAPPEAYVSAFTFSLRFIEQMLKFPGGIASHVPPSPYKKVEFLSHLQARNDLLKDLFLQESNPGVGLPSVVTGYNGKRQQILAGLDVLVSDQQTRQLRIMAEAFDAASMGQVLDLLNRADEEDAKKVRL
jgi:hypothetical protein